MVNQFSPVNWLFLGELIVVVIATAAFLFYWNRVLGSTVAWILRLVTWRWYNAYISIGSLQISPLAGRIAFRDVEYHSSNISCRVLHGNITFRYWKLRVRQDGDTGSNNPKRARLPCRISLTVEGAEAFFYNRTPAYDAIVERMKKREEKQREADAQEHKLSPSESASTSRLSASADGLRKRPHLSPEDSASSSKPRESAEEHSYPPKAPSETDEVDIETPIDCVSWFQEALPMEVQIITGSVILGSDATPMVLIADFKRADGVVDVSEPRSHCDYSKLSVNLGLQHVTVLMRTNPDYSGPLLAHGKRAYDEILTHEPEAAKQPASELTSRLGFQWLAKRLPPLFSPGLTQPPVSGMPADRVWKGLARYRINDEGLGSQTHNEDRQYAKVTTILKTRALDLCYASDSPGPVPLPGEARDFDLADQVGNVDLPPEYTVDLAIHGGVLNYGPWADRQRDALQKAFIPQSFFDTEPHRKLKPGETRLHTNLVVNVVLTDKTTLRIPTREPSKDWMFEGAKIDSERRYGWLDVVVGPNSSVYYTQSQVASEHGYDSMLVLHLDSLDIASSVNLQSFIVAKSCKLSMTMPNPLVWNAQRNWGLDLTLDTPDIRLLREHVALISDLSRDWSSGATGDFRHFVPVHYSFRISLIRYAIHLFINDFNIVDAPRSRDANAFCDILGPRLDAYVAVSSTRYKPEFSIVPFTIEAKDARVEMSLPGWDTHRTFGKNPLEVGKIGNVGVSGSYRYYSSPSPDHQEKLKLHIEAQNVAFIALGWAIRRLFCVKDNYFGGFTQFSTMQEFLEKFDHSPDSVGDPIMEKYRPGRSDSFAVHLTLDVVDSLVLMSDQVYGCDQGIAIPVQQLQLDLKTNEFQMDMTVDAAPTYVVACPDIADSYNDMAAPLARTQDVVFVEGIFIKANRLFGPQPKATTYFCLWELSFARVSAFLSPEFKVSLAGVGDSIGYNFNDRDNAPTSVYIAATPPDATFVKLSVSHVTALLSADCAGVALELPQGLFLDTSSMASQACRSVLGLGIPSIKAHILNRRSPHKGWEPVGSLGTGVSVDIFKIPEGWQEEAKEQNEFLREQDERRRVPYLYGASDKPWLGRHVNNIYLPSPKTSEHHWHDNVSEITSMSRRHDPGTSSAEWSDDSLRSVPLSRLSRRTRSPTALKPADLSDDNSIGDESDSVSTASSASTQSSHPSLDHRFHDIPSILEDRLKSFQRIHQRANRLFSASRRVVDSDADREMPYVPVSITNGSIFKVTLESTTVEVNPQTIISAHALVGGIEKVTPSPGILMDQLLTDHVAAVRKRNVRRSSNLFEIGLPTTDIRLVLGSFSNPEALAKVSLLGANARIVQQPAPNFDDHDASAVNLQASLRELVVKAGRNEKPSTAVSLMDVLRIPIEPRYEHIIPFAYITSRDLGFTFHKDPSQINIQAKAGDLSGHAATPGVPIAAFLVSRWKEVFSQLPKHDSPHAQANLIYDILQKIAHVPDLPLPAFVHEAAYGLHVDDQRSIRRDPGWYTLARLRQWMRLPQNTQPESRPSRPEMAKFVVGELAKLDSVLGMTNELVVSQPFLKKAFGKDLETAGLTPNAYAPKSVRVFANVETLSINHYGRLLESGAITKSRVALESASLSTERNTSWVAGVPKSELRSVATVQKVAVDIRNSFFSGVQAILTHIDTHREEIQELRVVQTLDHASTVIVDVHLDSVAIALTAGGLRLDLSLKGGHGDVNVQRSRRTRSAKVVHNKSHNHALVTCLAFKAVLREDPGPNVPEEDASTERALIITAIRGVRCTAEKQFDSALPKGGDIQLLLGIDEFQFDSLPQMKAFYDYARDWRDDHYHHYQPTIDQAKAVMKKRRRTPPPVSESESEALTSSQQLTLDLRLNSVRLQAHVAKGLWLAWEMGEMYVTRQGGGDNISFGLRVQPQTVGAYTTASRIKTRDSSVIRLPSIRATGSKRKVDGRPHISAMINLGLFTGIIKPAVLDRLLLLHQKIASDIIEVVREYRDNKKGQPQSVSPIPAPKLLASDPPLFKIQASFAGVRVGLRADDVPTTVMFEALNLQSSVGNAEGEGLKWSIKANHVGLSLIRMTDEPSYHSTEPAKGLRSVSMTCDISAHELPGTKSSPGELNVTLSRIHTVMHLAALSEVSDLIRSWTSDITLLRQVHRDEMEEVKEQTTMVLKKLDPARSSKGSIPASQADTPGPPELQVVTDINGVEAIETWFAARLITFEIKGFGVAFPLNPRSTIDVRRNTAGPALLYSIRELRLITSRNETARFVVQSTYLQFVEKFDPSNAEHFNSSSHHHHATNSMVLPVIDSEAQLISNKETWSVNAHCAATDFKLSLTPSIADSVARLTEMYDEGKAQLSVLERQYLAEWKKSDEPTDSMTAKYDTSTSAAPGKQLMVRMSFRFNSGKVELHRPGHHAHSHQPGVGEHNKSAKSRPRHDNIVLPTVSVWMDYSGSPPADNHASTLLFNMAVHESQNTLHPTVLPFFVDIMNRIETRAKKSRAEPPSPFITQSVSPNVSPRVPTKTLESEKVSMFTERAVERIAEAPTGKLRIRITLRIDRSELRLSCAPDSNAYVDLKWESGGFSVSTLLGGKDTTSMAGSVSGVTAYLSHEFAEANRGCITAGAKDLAFSVTLCTSERNQRGLSVVLDTQVSVQFRLEAFSAWLIFMSVWVDNAPKIGALLADSDGATASAPAIVTSPPASTKQTDKLGVAILVRLRSVDFDANVSVTQARLQLAPIVFRTVSDGEKAEIEATITRTQITAEGDISGNITSDNLKFKTVRRSSRATDATDPTVLSLSIEGGDLQGKMFINNMNIVRFHLEPTTVTLKDNWHEYAAHDPTAQVALDFFVKAGKFSGVLRLPAIPRLLGNFYSIFDLVESQTKIATHRSKTFKDSRRRNESATSTTVVLPSAQTTTGPMPSKDHIKTAQTMSFEIVGLDIGIFADDYEDGTTAEFYRFYVGKVKADLTRREERPSGLPLRDLLLHVAFVEWQTSDGRRATKLEKEQHDMSPVDLITAAVKSGHRDVVVLPSMTLTMKSTELNEPPRLDYDFDLVWGETNGDLMILPNFFDSAYKSFKKCMSGIDEQALKRARRRGIITARRKNVPEPAEPDQQMKVLTYNRRGTGPWNNPIPRLRALGETTGDAAMLIPKIRNSVGNLPTWSHRFVTLPLEDAMDLLLKLYERQMPDVAIEEE